QGFYWIGSYIMQKTFTLYILWLLVATLSSAEKPSNHPARMVTDTLGTRIPRDTSFTLHSTYLEERKYRPYIRIAEAKTPVVSYLDQAYDEVGGRPLLLDVFCPDGDSSKRYPGVLLIHGGGWQS